MLTYALFHLFLQGIEPRAQAAMHLVSRFGVHCVCIGNCIDLFYLLCQILFSAGLAWACTTDVQ
jgi:hypothetical protein